MLENIPTGALNLISESSHESRDLYPRHSCRNIDADVLLAGYQRILGQLPGKIFLVIEFFELISSGSKSSSGFFLKCA